LHLQAVQLDGLAKSNEILAKQLAKFEDRQNIEYTVLDGNKFDLEQEFNSLRQDVWMLQTKVERLDNYSGDDFKSIFALNEKVRFRK
jgi:hypothetical protein